VVQNRFEPDWTHRGPTPAEPGPGLGSTVWKNSGKPIVQVRRNLPEPDIATLITLTLLANQVRCSREDSVESRQSKVNHQSASHSSAGIQSTMVSTGAQSPISAIPSTKVSTCPQSPSHSVSSWWGLPWSILCYRSCPSRQSIWKQSQLGWCEEPKCPWCSFQA